MGQRLSFMELDINILYILCHLLKKLNGWYIPNINTIWDKTDGEEIVLLDSSKIVECVKKLNIKNYS